MTREEQIRQASIEYTIKNRPMCIGGGAFSEVIDEMNRNRAFEEGAKWVDANPNRKLVYTKKELLDMGFRFDQNGNISIPQEIEERKKQRIHHRKDKWIERACEWLDINFPTIDGVGSLYKESFIKQFKKAMEE